MAGDDQDDSQKTEEPTAKRLADARKKGDVVQSREVANFFMVLSGAMAVGLFLPSAGGDMLRLLTRFLERPHAIAFGEESMTVLMSEIVSGLAFALALPMALFVVAAAASSLVQHGLLFAPEKIKPSLDKVNPLSGLKRMFSIRSVTELLKGFVKIGVVAAVAAAVLLPAMEEIPHLPLMELGAVLDLTFSLALRILGGVTAVLAALALIDFLYQSFEHKKKLRMSRQEIRDEYKQSEGDPHVKARLRQIRNERARTRMMQAVPTADVVITNPTHFAVALKYDQDSMAAPRVVAKGADEVAFRIRAVAEENEVPIFENPPLTRAIFASVDIDEFIKPEHYRAVAEVIAFVMGLTNKRPVARPMDEPADTDGHIGDPDGR